MIILTSASHHRIELMLPVLLDIEAVARAPRVPQEGLLGEICKASSSPPTSEAAVNLKRLLLENRQTLDGLLGPLGLNPSLSPSGAVPSWAEPLRSRKNGRSILAALKATATLIRDDKRFYGHEPLLQEAVRLSELLEELAQLSVAVFWADSLVHGRYHANDVHDLSFLLTLFVAPERMKSLFKTLALRLRLLWQRQYFVMVDGQPLLWNASRSS